ncbi:hypothetical protein K3495_g7687 [Podosphaera aphanis]|nr:hypothetical protein K3495_g7687 [Podosphaera aphanis]
MASSRYEYNNQSTSNETSLDKDINPSATYLRKGDNAKGTKSDPPEAERIKCVGDSMPQQTLSVPITPPSVNPRKAKCSSCYLLGLPSELLECILVYLDPFDLASIAATCSRIALQASSDTLWYPHVQGNIPGVKLTSPAPCPSYKQLYRAHFPYWFIPLHKVWFGDQFLFGRLVIASYNPMRGQIEGYQLAVERPPPTFEHWELDEDVLVHSFSPTCRLNLEKPIIVLRPLTDPTSTRKFGEAVQMNIQWPLHTSPDTNTTSEVVQYISLARPYSVDDSTRPNDQIWPALTIPAEHWVRCASTVNDLDEPRRYSEASQFAFRTRQQFNDPLGHNSMLHELSSSDIMTYCTLDPRVYTPTEEKPYRGIWVGDYSGHGCEFLLMHQPDDLEPFDEASVVRNANETDEEFAARKREERIYRGSIEAIKLTGDPNVPRGEFTFIADDISSGGFIRLADDQIFKGARIVRSLGHIAARMFRHDKFIESQLILISHDRLAQYWVGFGHISFYERVDINPFLRPYAGMSHTS